MHLCSDCNSPIAHYKSHDDDDDDDGGGGGGGILVCGAPVTTHQPEPIDARKEPR